MEDRKSLKLWVRGLLTLVRDKQLNLEPELAEGGDFIPDAEPLPEALDRVPFGVGAGGAEITCFNHEILYIVRVLQSSYGKDLREN